MTHYAEEVLDLVLSSDRHPTAEQIYLALKARHSRISQATVYNQLHALVAAGRLIRLSEAGAPDRYDNTDRHDHLICTRCGGIADVTFKDLTAAIEAQLGCRIDSYDLRVRFVCPACRARETEA